MITLRSGDVIAHVAPDTGGRLTSLVVGGVERIMAKSNAPSPARPTSYGCYPMVPWAGRLEHGRIPTVAGEVRLDANHGPSAIHGLGFDKAWRVLERSEAAVVMDCELRGLGWPFGGTARQTMRLSPSALDLELEVSAYTRTGPAGLGWHPWFARPRSGDVEVLLDAHEVLVLDADKVPTGAVREVDASEDLRAGPQLGERRLDHVYVHSKAPAIVRWPDLVLEIEFDESLNTVVVHTPPQGFCVEPQTMWPNAPLLAARGVEGTGMRTLAPGERLHASHRWRWRPRDVR